VGDKTPRRRQTLRSPSAPTAPAIRCRALSRDRRARQFRPGRTRHRPFEGVVGDGLPPDRTTRPDVARAAIAALRDIAAVAEGTSSWPYRHDLDLTGFIDGAENPTLVEAPEVVLVPEGEPGAGGTIL
jgi:hypothetical protein